MDDDKSWTAPGPKIVDAAPADDLKARRKKEKKERKREERKVVEAHDYEIDILDVKHEHEMEMENSRAARSAATLEADRQFALQLIAAVSPLVKSFGAGIMQMQQNALAAQAKRLDVEATIAEKNPGYAAERVKLYAASGNLWEG